MKYDNYTVEELLSELEILKHENDYLKELYPQDVLKRENAELALVKERKFQDLLIKISSAYINVKIEDIDVQIKNSLSEIANFVEADRAFIFKYDFENETATATHEWTNEGIKPELHHFQNIPFSKISDWDFNSHKSGNYILIEDVNNLSAGPLKNNYIQQGLKTSFSFPLMDLDNCIGYIGIHWIKNYYKVSHTEIKLLNYFAGMISNVYSRIKNENLIREKDKRISSFNSNFKTGMIYQIIIDRKTNERKFTYLSDSVLSLYGVTPEQAYKESSLIYSRLYPEDVLKMSNAENEAIENFTNLKTEVRLINPDGSLRWSSFDSTPKYLDENTLCFDGIEYIITERKKVEETLQENQEILKNNELRLKMVLEATSDAVWEWNYQTGETYYSSRWYDILGYKDQEFDMGFDTWKSLCHPEDFENTVNKISAVLENPESKGYNAEFRMKNKTGDWVWILGRGNVVKRDEFGKPVLLAGTNSDISERKKAEQILVESESVFSEMFHKSPATIILTEPYTGVVLDVNETFLRDMEYKKEEAIGKSSVELGLFQNLQDREIMHEELKSKGSLFGFECTFRSKTGNLMIGLLSVVFIKIKGKLCQLNTVLNITEMKKIQNSLKQSEEKFRSIFETVSLIGLMLDKSGNITLINDYLLNLTGWTREEVLHKNWFEYFIPGKIKRELITDVFETSINTNKIKTRFENEILTKTGEIRLISWNNTVLKDSGANIIGVVSIGEDITDRKSSEIARERLLRILESSINEIYVFSASDLKFEYVNKSALTNLGFDIEEIKTMTPVDIKPEFDDDKFNKAIEPLLTGETQLLVFNTIHIRKDKSTYPVEVRLQLVEISDHRVFLAVILDVTEKQIRENALLENSRFLKETQKIAKLGSYSMDVLTGMWTSSEVLDEIFGINEEYERNVSGWGEIMHPDYYNEMINYLFTNVFVNKQPFDKEYKIIRKNDSEERWVHGLGSLKFDESGRVVKMLGTIMDITERKNSELLLYNQHIEMEAQYEEYMQLNEILRQTNYDLEVSKNKAEESDRLKTAFLQNVSHEIRTPLNGILGFAGLLNDDNLSKEEIQEYTSIITNSGKRLLETVNNVLDISKIETGQMLIKKEDFNVDKLLNDIYNFFYPKSLDINIKLIYLKNSNFENIVVNSDPNKINQIFTNLINNAFKFTISGEITFGYELHGEHVRFFVKDTGIGIPEEFKDKIFERFTHADLAITRGYEGPGLGLAICKGLIGELGGSIWVESKIKEGSAFYFTIPNVNNNTTLNNIEPHYNASKRIKEETEEKILILVVEDDWASFKYLSKLLKNTKCTLLHAENGKRAVEFVKIYPQIKFILMDIKMPIMDGYEATIEIKKIKPNLPIIAQTAYAFNEEKDKILKIGCDDYLSKPIEQDKLLNLIEKYTSL